MRAILSITILVALAWSGYWYVGAKAMQEGTNLWLAEQSNAGWTARAENVNTGGFPYRFDTALDNVELADPNGNWSWSAPKFQFLALSYQPTHFIAIWPDQQKLTIAGQSLSISSDQMRASAVFNPDPSFTLDRSNLVTDNLTLVSDQGWTLNLENGLLATRPGQTGGDTHEIGLNLTGIAVSENLRSFLDPAVTQPPVMDQIAMDATVAFDAPWNRHTVVGEMPQITAIDLASADARWGSLSLSATGKVTVDDRGFPSGQVSVTAVNWRQTLDMVVASGAISAETGALVARALKPIADTADQPNTITIPLRLGGGTIRIGLIPIAAAPRLILR